MTNPTKSEIEAVIRMMAPLYGLKPELIVRQCEAESGLDQSAVSNCGAIGLMQLMPSTAAGLEVDPNDWHANLTGGMKYMGQLLSRFGDIAKALAAYNCGPGRLEGILETYGADWRDHLPAETRGYLRRILCEKS